MSFVCYPSKSCRPGTGSPVEVLSAHHDWLDYLAALAGVAGLVGAVVAIVALIFAKRSAGDASRSAEAAEKSLQAAGESLSIMREEAEAAREARQRRADPVVEVTHAQPRNSSDTQPGASRDARTPREAQACGLAR
jgi:hypothetical protein